MFHVTLFWTLAWLLAGLVVALLAGPLLRRRRLERFEALRQAREFDRRYRFGQGEG